MMLLTTLTLSLLAQSPEVALRRFALVAGANDGGNGRNNLRYANSDARAMSKVLTQLGGVDPRDVLLVEDPTPAQLTKTLDELEALLRTARTGQSRLEVFFYYSGHSDEQGLLLKGQRFSYTKLREKLDSLTAEVRIAVLDSCASGALTLLKGGAPRPSFLIDSATSLSGHAFLTSSSADEAAQESERLKASIFTHFFLSGLRGAADASRDGRVTLAEAYQYAFAETLTRTTSTQAGPQRPGWDIQLVGTGDLVLTDLRASDAKLVLDAQLGGRINVLGANGGLVVEVSKAPGKPVELGLEAGDYRVVVDDGAGSVSEARITLSSQGPSVLKKEALVATSLESTVRRGTPERPSSPVELAFIPSLRINDTPPQVNFGFGLLGIRVGSTQGMLLSSIVNWSDDYLHGLGVAGVLMRTGDLKGLGVSGVLVVSNGDVVGLTATTVSIATGDVFGITVGAGVAALGNLNGLQASAANITLGSVRGLQAGAVNFAGGGLRGLQVSAVNYVNDSAIGLQTAAVNIARGGFGGLQVGAANFGFAESFGGQLGVINVGGDVTGAQIGVLNIAKSVTGTQIGLINIAQTSSAPVGLISVITQGKFNVAAWANETSVANLALKAGSRHVYSLLVGSLNPRGGTYLGAGLGLGVRAFFGERWYGELEGTCQSLLPTRPATPMFLSADLRLNVGYQLFERFSVFAGPQLQTLVAFDSTNSSTLRALSPWGFDPSSSVRLVPGVVVGVQVL